MHTSLDATTFSHFHQTTDTEKGQWTCYFFTLRVCLKMKVYKREKKRWLGFSTNVLHLWIVNLCKTSHKINNPCVSCPRATYTQKHTHRAGIYVSSDIGDSNIVIFQNYKLHLLKCLPWPLILLPSFQLHDIVIQLWYTVIQESPNRFSGKVSVNACRNHMYFWV